MVRDRDGWDRDGVYDRPLIMVFCILWCIRINIT